MSQVLNIYQIGVILFQLLNGLFPNAPVDWLNDRQKIKLSKITGSFDQWEYIEECIYRKIISSTLLDNNSLPIYIDNSLKRIINSATNNDLSKRYRSCAEFLKALFDYSKKAKDWKTEDDIIFAADKNQNEYKIYQSKKGYVLETKKKNGNWRKDNRHSGNLPEIINYLT